MTAPDQVVVGVQEEEAGLRQNTSFVFVLEHAQKRLSLDSELKERRPGEAYPRQVATARPEPIVTAVSTSPKHGPFKENREAIRLVAGVGVVGDAHAGATIKHRSRARKDKTAPNLRQVHLIHSELFEELREQGLEVASGQMGENVTTRGVDLLSLPRGTRLALGATAVVELTGLRNPCKQLERVAPGLMKATLERSFQGELVRKAGVMGIVLEDGDVLPHGRIAVTLPSEALAPLEPV